MFVCKERSEKEKAVCVIVFEAERRVVRARHVSVGEVGERGEGVKATGEPPNGLPFLLICTVCGIANSVRD